MEVVWLAAGLVVGAAGALFLLGRLSDRRVAEAEERVTAQLEHARDETLQADIAHNETKARLVDLQMEHVALGKRGTEAERRAADALASATSANRELTSAQNRARELEARMANLEQQAKAAAEAAAQTRAAPPDARTRRLKSIEARLAMLPAGSSARMALEKERDRLIGG